jgi:hypothetical protein
MFVSEPIGRKPVDHLPGIGKALSKRLIDKNFTMVLHVVGKFLVLGMHKENFCAWLKDEIGANNLQCNMCFESLEQWCKEFIL